MTDLAWNTLQPETMTHTLWMTWCSCGGPKQIPDLIKLTLRFNKHSQVTCVWNVYAEPCLETDAVLIHKNSRALSSISLDDKAGSSQMISNVLISSREWQRWICEVSHISSPERFIMTHFAHASVAISFKVDAYLLQTRLLNRNQKKLSASKSTPTALSEVMPCSPLKRLPEPSNLSAVLITRRHSFKWSSFIDRWNICHLCKLSLWEYLSAAGDGSNYAGWTSLTRWEEKAFWTNNILR